MGQHGKRVALLLGVSLVLENAGLARKLAQRYTRVLSREDAIGEAMLGLAEAASRFDATLEVPFGGYARHWILMRLRRAAKNTRPVSGESRADRVKATASEAFKASHKGVSLDTPLSSDEGTGTLGDSLPSEGIDLQALIDERRRHERLQAACAFLREGLSPRDATILDRCVLGGEEQPVLAAEYGLTKQRVGQIVKGLEKRLKSLL